MGTGHYRQHPDAAEIGRNRTEGDKDYIRPIILFQAENKGRILQ